MSDHVQSTGDHAKPIGLLLAAGRARRMGLAKQVLPWPSPESEMTIVASSFDSIAPFCARMVVTFGHEAQAIGKALGNREFDSVMCDADAPMFDSVRAGLERVRGIDPTAPALLLPADQPGIRPESIRAILKAGLRHPEHVVAPELARRGGHPVLISPTAITIVLSDSGDGGLRGVWDRNPSLRVRIEVDDPACARDIDTPEDYARALHAHG